jgi:hypothetical protein
MIFLTCQQKFYSTQLVDEFVQLHDRQISKTPHQFDLVLDGWSATRKLS